MADDYHSYMAEAARYREMAANLDGYQREAVLQAAREVEAKARFAKQKAEKSHD